MGKIVVQVLHAFGNNKHMGSDRQNRIARALVGKSYIMLDVAIAQVEPLKPLRCEYTPLSAEPETSRAR